MTDDKQKLNGIGKIVLIVMLAFAGVAFWICIEFGQWIGRQQ
jgi:hypothetical protein